MHPLNFIESSGVNGIQMEGVMLNSPACQACLESFRDAYDLAFASDPPINAALTHDAINALAAVRHLLVHKSGVVDQDFLDEMPKAPLLAKFAVICKDVPLPFEGKAVRSIVDEAVTQGYNLLRAVDRWLMSKHLASLKP